MWVRTLLDPLKRVWRSTSGVAAIAMAEEPSPRKVAKVERQFDFKRFAKRHVLLMVSYLGWDYHGLVYQPDCEGTIEEVLHKALLKTKLIESTETANFSRCGRTDKGVSAFRQVISLDVRSLASEGEGVFIPEGYSPCNRLPGKSDDSEMNYISTLNRALPTEVQVLAWAPAALDFSARFQCLQRTYKYYFPRGDVDIEAMRAAGQLLIGQHDFRNFCKLDLSSNYVKETIRNITSVSIEQADLQHPCDDPYSMYVLTISASSFLWHQIRNIVTLLVLIGKGREKIDIITSLLDIQACPRKPQYSPALETPLILYDCQYENVQWRWETDARRNTIHRLQGRWLELAAKAQMVKSMCEDLSREAASQDPSFIPSVDVSGLVPGDKRRRYLPLLKRPTALSLEEHQARCELRKEQKEREKSQSPVSDNVSE